MRENAGSALISVRRVVGDGRGATGAVSVRFQTTTGGTASVNADFRAVTGTLYWANGDSAVKTFSVRIVDDSEHEPTETVFLRLYDVKGPATIAPTRQNAPLSILDNDVADTISPRVTISRPVNATLVANINSIEGTASDEGGSGLASVVLVIRRVSDHKFWNGTEWVAGVVSLPTVLRGTTWSRTSGNPVIVDDYLDISAIATDGAGNTGRVYAQVHVQAQTPLTITISRPSAGTYIARLERCAGFTSGGSGGSKVDIYLRRARDGKFWTGREWGVSTPLPAQLAPSGEWSRTEWPALDAGSYTLGATVSDSAGHFANAYAEFLVGSPTTRSGADS